MTAHPSLAGRTILVTGASGGIGSGIAAAMGDAGATVIAHYSTHLESARAAVAAIPSDRSVLVQADLSSARGARQLWSEVTEQHDVDAVVLNAAVIDPTPLDGPDAEWDAGWEHLLKVNVIGSGALMREAARTFAERGHGTVVTMSSWAAEQGSRIRDVSGYAASKAAIRNLAQTFARHYADRGVRMHIVAPGVVNAGMGTRGQDDAEVERVAGGLAMRRLVTVHEVAQLVTYLCSDSAASLTGATIDINGASYIR